MIDDYDYTRTYVLMMTQFKEKESDVSIIAAFPSLGYAVDAMKARAKKLILSFAESEGLDQVDFTIEIFESTETGTADAKVLLRTEGEKQLIAIFKVYTTKVVKNINVISDEDENLVAKFFS